MAIDHWHHGRGFLLECDCCGIWLRFTNLGLAWWYARKRWAVFPNGRYHCPECFADFLLQAEDEDKGKLG